MGVVFAFQILKANEKMRSEVEGKSEFFFKYCELFPFVFNDSYRKSSYCHILERNRNHQVCLVFHQCRDRARSHQTASARF